MSGTLGTDRSRETLRILRDNITSGRWPLNSRIPTETELMADLGVGRSTVREAVSSLAALGMLEPARSRGTFVRSLSPVSQVLSDFVGRHAPADILAVRTLLESEAARLASEQRSDAQLERLTEAYRADVDGECTDRVSRGDTPGQFHALVMEASGNTLLAELQAGLMHGLRAALVTGQVTSGITAAQRHDDHFAILTAITERDPATAARAAADHAARDLRPTE